MNRFANGMFKTMVISSGIGGLIGAIRAPQTNENKLCNAVIYSGIGFTAPIVVPILTLHYYLFIKTYNSI